MRALPREIRSIDGRMDPLEGQTSAGKAFDYGGNVPERGGGSSAGIEDDSFRALDLRSGEDSAGHVLHVGKVAFRAPGLRETSPIPRNKRDQSAGPDGRG
jgi:hypothetical protein